MTVNCKIVTCAKEERIWIKWLEAKVNLNPNRPLDYYALTNFGINPTISRHGIAQARLALLIWLNEMVLFGICLPVSRLQWSPIAPSKREHIFSKIEVVIIITLMTDLGLITVCISRRLGRGLSIPTVERIDIWRTELQPPRKDVGAVIWPLFWFCTVW